MWPAAVSGNSSYVCISPTRSMNSGSSRPGLNYFELLNGNISFTLISVFILLPLCDAAAATETLDAGLFPFVGCCGSDVCALCHLWDSPLQAMVFFVLVCSNQWRVNNVRKGRGPSVCRHCPSSQTASRWLTLSNIFYPPFRALRSKGVLLHHLTSLHPSSHSPLVVLTLFPIPPHRRSNTISGWERNMFHDVDPWHEDWLLSVSFCGVTADCRSLVTQPQCMLGITTHQMTVTASCSEMCCVHSPVSVLNELLWCTQRIFTHTINSIW